MTINPHTGLQCHHRPKCASDHADINKAGELLGHQSVSMTKAVYDRSVRVVRPLK